MLPIEEATELFAVGQFSELVRRSRTLGLKHLQKNPHLLVLVAHAMITNGDSEAVALLGSLDDNSLPAPVKARALLARGHMSRLTGEITKAAQQFRAALTIARESKDSGLIAWASVFLLNLLVTAEARETVAAAIPDVRKAAVNSGDPHAIAYLHQAISVCEGQTGNFDEARRHCDVVDAMLAIRPNAWLASNNAMNRVSVDLLTCHYRSAVQHIRSARRLCTDVGFARGLLMADGNDAHAHLLMGDYKRASDLFAGMLNSSATSLAMHLGALEGMARAHLALDQFEHCGRLLREIDDQVHQDHKLRALFHARWALITKARLHLKCGQFDEAIAELRASESLAQELTDTPLAAATHFTLAQAFGHANPRDAALHLLKSDAAGATSHIETQAQYYFAASSIVNGELAKALKERALALWKSQGVKLFAKEMEIGAPHVTAKDRSHDLIISFTIANRLGSTIDLAHNPELLGQEMVSVLGQLGMPAHLTISDRQDNTSNSLALGFVNHKRVVLTYDPPNDAVRAVVLADVLRIGRAAVALEKHLSEERKRAAVWPADPVETEAGALFLAEEMQALLATARRVAPTNVPVLIYGETGTGKEVLARLIHAYSNRARATFLPFNCSAVPKDMLDSQLFGHRRGSFTGAAENFQGVIRAAGGGTLLLDEIGETTLDVQPKLLRFLESGEVHPIGELHPTRVDVRVIAATNADLDKLVSEGRFREDLFYRLNIVRLHLPPLRERRVEIPALASHYLRKHAQEFGKGDLRLSEETMEYLVLYRWPGNVRQLANEMRKLAALAETGAVLMPEHLSPDIAASRRTIPASERALEPTEVVVRLDQPMAAAVQHVERALILHALKQTGSNMEASAALLGVSRKGLYLKRQRYGIEAPGDAGDSAVA